MITIGRLLAMDTSTASMTVAIMDGNQVLEETNSIAERNHSIHLMPIIEKLLVSVGLKTADLDGIAVGVGPGSYTGVRIGVTAAKTLAWAIKVPLFGVSSLEALAYGAVVKKDDSLINSTKTVWYIPIMDARRGQVYTGLYADIGKDAEAKRWACIVQDGIRLMAHWTDQLTALSNGSVNGLALPDSIVFVGNTDHCAENIREMAERCACSVTAVPNEIHASYIGELALIHRESAEIKDVHSLIPNYTQMAEAEVNWLAKQR